MQRELVEMTPVDLNLYKTANLPESYIKYGKEVKTTEAQRADSRITLQETLKNNGLDMTLLKDVNSYEIVETAGFPEMDKLTTPTVGSHGSCVVPVNLANSVVWLHEFLFEEEGYQVTEQVQNNSNEIDRLTSPYIGQ